MSQVALAMEQMLPELKDYEKKGIFSHTEIKAIVSQRQAFETALVRRVVQRADYLRYIEYEINLDGLKRKRVARLRIPQYPSPSTFASQRRILHIFERATKKFRADILLWLRYIEYAKKSGAARLVGRLFASVINLHPTNPQLYILAAAHELHANMSAASARALLQRGLRLNPHDVDLWVEYAKMEMVFVERLRRRKELLGEGEGAKKVQEKGEGEGEEGEGEGVKLDPLDESKAAPEKDIVADVPQETQSVMDGSIIRTIVNNGVKTLPQTSHLPFHIALLALLRSFPLPAATRTALLSHTYTSLASARASDPAARTIVAERYLADAEGAARVDALKKAVDELKSVAEELQNGEMWESVARWLSEKWESEEEENLRLFLSHHLASAHKRASALSLLTPPTSLIYLTHLRASASPNLLKAARAATKQFANSGAIWEARIDAESDDDEALFLQARASCPRALGVWERWLRWAERQVREGRRDGKWLNGVYEDAIHESLRDAASSAVSSDSSTLTLHDRVLLLYLLHHFTSTSPPPSTLPTAFTRSSFPSPAFFPHALTQPHLAAVQLDLYARWAAHPRVSAHHKVSARLGWIGALVQRREVKGAEKVFWDGVREVQGETRERERLEEGWRRALDGEGMDVEE